MTCICSRVDMAAIYLSESVWLLKMSRSANTAGFRDLYDRMVGGDELFRRRDERRCKNEGDERKRREKPPHRDFPFSGPPEHFQRSI